MGSLFLLGAACWAVVDPRRPVFAEERTVIHGDPSPVATN
jgi:hypothetical protein